MFSKTTLALPLAASLLEHANAFSFHRHQHAAEKRDNIVWETVTQVVYVTAGVDDASPAETAAANFVEDTAPVVTVDATPAQAPPAAAPPAPVPTTLATAVKPAVNLPNLGGILPTKASSSAPSSTGLGFAKQGIAYNDAGLANTFKEGCKSCGWSYNWGSSPGNLDSNIPFVPMLWGDLPVHTSHWDSDAEAALAKGAKALLSFNEPDMPSQANMDPSAAAAAHAKYFSKYVGRAQIGSPAVSNSGQAGQGVQWLKSFVDACDARSDCHIDFCAVHWYSEAQYSETLFDHIKAAKAVCHDKPIWLTEFAPFGSDEQISGFINDVIPKLNKLDDLHAYSYFMVAQNHLMSSPSLLSTIGKAYAAITN